MPCTTGNFFAKCLLSIAAVILVGGAEAHGQTAYARTLKLGKKLTVVRNGCKLAVSKNTPSKVVIKCSGSAPAGRSTGRQLLLRKGDKVTVKPTACELSLTKNTKSKVAVLCAAPATPTPTATSTATSTHTSTATSTPTSTATSTPTVTSTPTPTPTADSQALLTGNRLLSFNSSSPSSASISALTGVSGGQSLVSIDRRPVNGRLYALGVNSASGEAQLYAVSVPGSSVQTVGASQSFTTDGVTEADVSGAFIGMDFNPAADRVRVVTTDGQNFRVNPNSGSVVDGNLGGGGTSGVNMDGAINTGTTTVGETAYTNNSSQTSITTQYTIDASTDALYIQTPPNAGTQTGVQALSLGGNALAIEAVRGFDIPQGVNAGSSGTAVTSGSGFAVLEFSSNSQQRFCAVDLTNGEVTDLSEIGDGEEDVLGLALQSITARTVIGVSTETGGLVRFAEDAPGTLTTVALSGLTGGEALAAIAYRPSTGQLYGIGIDAAGGTGTLYIIDPITGACTTIGAASSLAFTSDGATQTDLGSLTDGWGLAFNPVTEQAYVSCGSVGLHFRIDPDTGNPIDGDSGITGTNPDPATNGATTSVQSVAFTNSFGGAAVTTLYTLDHLTNSLHIQSPPTSGTQTSGVPITLGGSPLDFENVLGFAIGSEVVASAANTAVSSGVAYAHLPTDGGTTFRFYKINLVTGAATDLGAVGTGTYPLRSMVIGEIYAR